MPGDTGVKGAIKRVHNAGVNSARDYLPEMDISMLIDVAKRCAAGEDKQSILLSIADEFRPAMAAYMDNALRTGIDELLNNSDNLQWNLISKASFSEMLQTITKEVAASVEDYCSGQISAAEFFEIISNKEIPSLFEPTLNVLGFDKQRLLENGEVFLNTWSNTIGYAAAVKAYEMTMEALEDASEAYEIRKERERQSQLLIEQIKQYRYELETLVHNYLGDHLEKIDYGFSQMNKALLQGSSDDFIKGNIIIQDLLNYSVQFRNQKEFDDLMESDIPLKL